MDSLRPCLAWNSPLIPPQFCVATEIGDSGCCVFLNCNKSGTELSHLIFFQGMPGTKFPDALLVVPSFPPSKPIIQAFLDCGFYFRLALPIPQRVFLQIGTSSIHVKGWVPLRVQTSCQRCGTVTIFYGSGSDFWKVVAPVPVPTFEK
jgi:hypothetical protein